MKNITTTLLLTIVFLLAGCSLKDEMTTTVKRKAIVHLVYHYDNGREATMKGIESMRLFIYDQDGTLYRDAAYTPAEFLRDTGIMQTYLSNGHYSFISWANIGSQTSVAAERLSDGMLTVAASGADPLLFGRCDAPVIKGDSLLFDIHLFKSVYLVNVRVTGLGKAQFPEDHYFGIMNRSGLTIDNRPSGELKRCRPALTYDEGTLRGSFYTPYFSEDDDLTVGVYCNNPESPYTALCETSIHDFADFIAPSVGRDVEINVDIEIQDAGISIRVTDWEGTVIQEENVGK